MENEINAVGWFELYCKDLSRAQAFYEAVFEVKLEKLQTPAEFDDPSMLEMLAFPMLEGKQGAPGAICKMEGVEPGIGGTIVYFNCEDCANEEARVTANGGQVLKSKFPIGPHGFIVIVMDTEGNMIGLHSMK